MTLLPLVLAVSIAVGAQTNDEAKRSDAILMKARQLDLLNHMLPMTFTKSQINALLVPIEKARQNVKKIASMEAADLAKFEAKIGSAVDSGVNDAKVPSPDLLKEVNRLFTAFTVRRQIAAGENADLVYEVMLKVLNKGQLAVAAKTIDPNAYDPTVDLKTWTDEMRTKLFIKDVLLDPASYDLMVKMSKKAP